MLDAQRLRSRFDRTELIAEVGSWELSLDTGELVWSDNLFRLYGLAPGEIVPSRDYALGVCLPDDRDRLSRLLAFVGEDGHVAPFDYRIVRPDGTTRRLRSSVGTVESGGVHGDSVVGVVEDVTDEVDADQKIASHIAVSAALDAWESLDEGAYRLLGDLATAMAFHVGTLWVPAGEVLVARAVWTDAAHDAATFESATRSLRLGRGDCLPGRVWELGEPLNVVDIRAHRSYGRRAAAERSGLRGAVGVAAVHSGEVLAVIELNSREPAKLSRRLMLSLRALGSELGQFLAHRHGELDLTALTPRQLEVLQLAAQGCSGREIAERLFISTTTVKSHFESIYARLGVSDRASAVAEAMRCGLIT